MIGHSQPLSVCHKLILALVLPYWNTPVVFVCIIICMSVDAFETKTEKWEAIIKLLVSI